MGRAKKGEYVGVVVEGDSMSLSTLKIGKTLTAAVKFTGDDRIVQRGTPQWADRAKPALLQSTATRMAKKWNAYLTRTGKRWELEQDAKKAKKAAAAKIVADRNRRARDKSGELVDLLGKITGHWDFGVLLEKETTGDRLVQAARAARELLDFIETGKESAK